MKSTIKNMKYVNQSVMNVWQKMRFKITKKTVLILKKDSEHNKITREKLNLKIWSPQNERQF